MRSVLSYQLTMTSHSPPGPHGRTRPLREERWIPVGRRRLLLQRGVRMAVAASPGATPHGIAGAALAVGAAVPAGSLPSLLLRLSAPAAWRQIMRALCFMWQ